MPEIGFIVNPTAGRGSGRRHWDTIVGQLRQMGEFSVWFSDSPGHATELARRAANAGYRRVAAVGGDGTMGEVMNGLVGTGTALGVVPGGTGNDFAREMGIPMPMKVAAELIFTGETRPVDVGAINPGKYFINVAGVGFDAEVARTVNSYPKYLGGTIPYLLGIVKTLWRYRPVPLEIELDGRLIKRKVLLMAIANAPSYGGGMKICPGARVDDGLFDICIGGDVGPMEVLKLVPSIYKGGHVTHPKVEMIKARRVEVRSAEPVAGMADGDLIGTTPFVYELLPKQLDVVVPSDRLPLFV